MFPKRCDRAEQPSAGQSVSRACTWRTSSRVIAAALLAMCVTGLVSIGLPASDVPQTPVSNTLEITEDDCGPLLVLAPADVAFQLRIENGTSSERVIALPPDGTRISIGPQSSETVSLELRPGQYRIVCDSAADGDATVVMLEAIEGEVFEPPPETPLATPIPGGTPVTS